MRIIAGKYRSQTLAAPPGWKTRPTGDRLRETLFNVLVPRIQDAVFADLYSGTGAVGIEALSRGARKVYFAENARVPLTVLRSNLAKLRIGSEAEVESGGTSALLRAVVRRGIRLDIVFLDPPYSDEAAYVKTLEFLADEPCLSPQAIVIAEHARRAGAFPSFGDLCPYRTIPQGEAALTFFRCNSSPLLAGGAASENPS